MARAGLSDLIANVPPRLSVWGDVSGGWPADDETHLVQARHRAVIGSIFSSLLYAALYCSAHVLSLDALTMVVAERVQWRASGASSTAIVTVTQLD